MAARSRVINTHRTSVVESTPGFAVKRNTLPADGNGELR